MDPTPLKTLVVISSWHWQTEIAECWHTEEFLIILCDTEKTGPGWHATSFWNHFGTFSLFTLQCWELWISSVLTILCRINDGCYAEGSLSFAVERFDFDLKLCRWRESGVLVDVALGLGVGHRHLPPLVIVLRFKGHDVAKVRPVVVLWLHRLMTETSHNYVNVANVLSNTHLSLRVLSGNYSQASSTYACPLYWSSLTERRFY